MSIGEQTIKDSIEYMIAHKNIKDAIEAVNLIRTIDGLIESEGDLQKMRILMIYSITANMAFGAFHKILEKIKKGEDCPADPIDALIFALQEMKNPKPKLNLLKEDV